MDPDYLMLGETFGDDPNAPPLRRLPLSEAARLRALSLNTKPPDPEVQSPRNFLSQGPATQAYLNLLNRPRTPTPVLRPDIGQGVYVDSSGQVQKPSRGSTIFGNLAAGFIGGIKGGKAGQDFSNRYFNTSYGGARNQYEAQEEDRAREVKELLPMAEREEQRAWRMQVAQLSEQERQARLAELARHDKEVERLTGQRQDTAAGAKADESKLAWRKLGLNPDQTEIPESQFSATERLKLQIDKQRAFKKPLAEQMADAWLEQNPGKTLVDFEQWRTRLKQQLPPGIQQEQIDFLGGVALTNPAFLSSLGFGAQLRGPVAGAMVNEAKERGITPSEVATRGAEFAADKASLAKMTQTYNNMTAFKSAAGKNLDYAVSLAAKVPDSGSKLLNMPLRAINDQIISSEKQSEYWASLLTAAREIARVTNNPNLTGQLTDTARGHVETILNPNATLGQILGAARALKTDMDNVESSYRDALETNKKKMRESPKGSGKSGQSQPKSISTRAEFDSLPDGAAFVKDGKSYVKQGVQAIPQ